MSAGGRNPEILDALRASSEPSGIACASEDNPLVASAPPKTLVYAVGPPTGRDGFLATNTLLAMCVWLARAYGTRLNALGQYNMAWAGLIAQGFVAVAGRAAAGMADRRHVLVLADMWSWLAVVQITDWRNFVHGRHH